MLVVYRNIIMELFILNEILTRNDLKKPIIINLIRINRRKDIYTQLKIWFFRNFLDLVNKYSKFPQIIMASKKIDPEELKKRLTPLQYKVTQEQATERPFSGEYDIFFQDGNYFCVVCNQRLFESTQKFDSGCGWPAFFDSQKGSINEKLDQSHGMMRVEVVCSGCNAHLGHLFEDGPLPTRRRYCINSASLNFEKKM